MKIVMGAAVLMEQRRPLGFLCKFAHWCQNSTHLHKIFRGLEQPFFTLFLCIQFPRPGTSEWRSPDTPPPDNHTTAVQYDGNKFRS